MISYKPFFNTLDKKNVSQYKLLQSGIDNRLLNALKNNKSITLYNLEKICKILQCDIKDVVEFVDDEEVSN